MLNIDTYFFSYLLDAGGGEIWKETEVIIPPLFPTQFSSQPPFHHCTATLDSLENLRVREQKWLVGFTSVVDLCACVIYG